MKTLKRNHTLIIVSAVVSLIFGLVPFLLPLRHPPAFALQLLGLTSIASSAGYLIMVFAVALLHRGSWLKSFVASFRTVSMALFVFYAASTLRTLLWGNPWLTNFFFPTTHAGARPLDNLTSFAQWVFTAFFASALAATVVHVIRKNKRRAVSILVAVLTYAGLLFVIYFERGRGAIRIWRFPQPCYVRCETLLAGRVANVVILVISATVVMICVYRTRKQYYKEAK